MGTKLNLNPSPISNSLLHIRSLCCHATLVPTNGVTTQRTAVEQTISVTSFPILFFFFSVFNFPFPVLVTSITYPLLFCCFQEIDGRALLLLTQEMLESLTENKLGPMTKIQSAVKALKQAWGIWKYHEDNMILWTRQFYWEFQAALIRWLYNCFVVIIPKCFITKYFIIFSTWTLQALISVDINVLLTSSHSVLLLLIGGIRQANKKSHGSFFYS